MDTLAILRGLVLFYEIAVHIKGQLKTAIDLQICHPKKAANDLSRKAK